MTEYPLYIAGQAEWRKKRIEVSDKFTGEKAVSVSCATEEDYHKATDAAVASAKAMSRLSAAERRRILEFCISEFEKQREKLAVSLCLEAGKPIRDARGEVGRLIETFRIASEECLRIGGEYQTLDRTQANAAYTSQTKRVAVGPCFFITPFNFPLNLVAHKVAPAIAAGCPFVLKPASRTPIGALIIGEILSRSGLPQGAFSILPTERATAQKFISDERFELLSFTGSQDAGWSMKAQAGRKKVCLELGGNAAVIVDEDSALDDVVARIIIGAFYQSGQSCISVQRIIAHENIYKSLREKLKKAVSKLKTGDPRDEETFVGPLIASSEVQRLQSWIAKAQDGGAQLICGGVAEGEYLFQPTLLENVPQESQLYRREAFGPVAVMEPFSSFEEALELVNHSDYGLQAGVFCNDIHKAWQAWDDLEVGGVVINDVPSWRADEMPYGGVKQSGFGREGIRWAIEEMTELRLMVLRRKK